MYHSLAVAWSAKHRPSGTLHLIQRRLENLSLHGIPQRLSCHKVVRTTDARILGFWMATGTVVPEKHGQKSGFQRCKKSETKWESDSFCFPIPMLSWRSLGGLKSCICFWICLVLRRCNHLRIASWKQKWSAKLLVKEQTRMSSNSTSMIKTSHLMSAFCISSASLKDLRWAPLRRRRTSCWSLVHSAASQPSALEKKAACR